MTVTDMDKRNEALALFQAWTAAEAAVEAAEEGGADSELAALRDKADDAYSAYSDHPTPALITNWSNTEVRFCGKTNVPLWEADEVLEDAHTGEMFLRSALGLPPRPETDEDVEAAA